MQLELLDPLTPATERIWRELDEEHPRSYFLSWGWIENWLASLPREVLPQLAVIRDGRRARSAFFLSRRLVLRYRVMPSRAVYFNTTGIERYDDLWLEYNGLVGRDVGLEILTRLLPRGWDEVFLPGLSSSAFGGPSQQELPDASVRIERKVPSYYVDLTKVRAKDYLSLLHGQTRSQVRRAQREAGELTTEVATTAERALEIYGEMTALHGKQWQDKGKPGAFADPWFDGFHRRLIATRFQHGEIQLLHVRTAAGTVGALYNFVHRGRVLQYQSGLAQFANKHLKPGYVVHAAAIAHAATAGHAIYDFLGGEMRYKKSLGSDCDWLYWVRVQRLAIRFMLEDRLRAWASSRRAVREIARS